jgi:pimeloyl-ACP methyl ester carboxylesterase
VAHIDVAGIGIEYELLGKPGDHAVALSPGGRFSKDIAGLRELGEALVAGGKRVLLWDRPNCGLSDICFEGDNESAMQGRVLTQLIRKLDLGPTVVGGGSAGSRTSLFAAVHDPEIVSHLMLWWVSGGAVSVLTLGAAYFGTPAAAARMFGLEAVLGLPQWDPIKNDPKKRAAFLKQDPNTFIATMERWSASFIPSESSPVPGMTSKDFARLTMPVGIVRGSVGDIYHPASVAEAMQKIIPQAELIDPPWDDESPMRCLIAAAPVGGSPFQDWPNLAPKILEFTNRKR